LISKFLKSKLIQETATYSIQQSHQVKSFLVNRQEGAFGFEYYLDHIDKKLTFYTDYLSRTKLTPTRPIYLDPTRTNMSCYYLRTQQPNYAPFSFTSVEDVWNLIQKYTHSLVIKGVKIYIQCLFQYADEKWKVIAYDKYNGYLDGIANLSMNHYIQNLQYKVANFFHTRKPLPIDETMDKLEQDGYSTCVRLVVEGDEKIREKVMDKILLAFNTQRFVNGWEYKQAVNKQKFITDCQTRIFPSQFREQILCPSEMSAFFGGGEVDKEQLSLKPVTKLIAEHKPELTTSSKPLVLDPDTEEIVNDLTAAMKKLKLTKGEELKVVDFSKSLTLNMISFERPADLPIDKLRKRTEDIEIEMHVEGISFDQGTKKGSIAFMYPRRDREKVTLETMLNDKDVKQLIQKQELPVIVGVDIYGNPLIYDLTKLVHVLIAGATNMGKSVFENILLLSLTYHLSPDELELYLIDPKQVELSDYEHFPHVSKLVTDSKKASSTLNKIIDEMEERYSMLKDAGVKNIQEYNQKHPQNKMSYIVVVIDEFADLMLIDNSVEDFVQRLSAKSRASGIHLVICTQRPSVDVITGVIKANMMTRIGFTCKSHHDYKTIFDYMIPYRLLGKGDGVVNWHGNDAQFVRFQSPINEDGDIFDKILEKWGGKVKDEIEAEYEEMDEDVMDEKYLLLKRVICETGETRNRQLQQLTNIGTHKIKDYLSQLEEEGWLEKNQRGQYKLLLTDEQVDVYLTNSEEEE
jgi:S-DNA-T family DNA segregation ATPase FtsK/SpoIIIE